MPVPVVIAGAIVVATAGAAKAFFKWLGKKEERRTEEARKQRPGWWPWPKR